MNTIDYVSSIKFYPSSKQGSLVANGVLTIADSLAVKFSLFETGSGVRLSLPASPNPKFDSSRPAGKDNKKYFDEVYTISAEARKGLEEYVIGQFQQASATKDKVEDNIPF